MAVKPWLGAVKKPEEMKKVKFNKTPPDEQYEVDFVHGYKSDSVRQNLFFNPQGHPVYMTAALGVILDPEERSQKIFGGGEE